MWTRFHPLADEVAKVLGSGKLGEPRRFQADFSMEFNPDSTFLYPLSGACFHAQLSYLGRPTSHRMLDPALGGGSLLDM